jgi:flavin-dependent dehydrogenase
MPRVTPLRMNLSPDSFDVIIVGARVAGSAAAIVLARSGLRVLMLDKSAFPSDTLSTHIVLAGGARVLTRMGVMDLLERAGGVRFARMRTAGPGFDYSAPLQTGGADLRGLCLRRSQMDAAMVDVARSHENVVMRERMRLTDLVIDGGEIVGVRAEDPTGSHTFHAPLVIGADGMRSTVAQITAARIGAFAREDVACVRAYYYGYFSGVDPRQFGDDLLTEFEASDGAANLVCRCDGGLVVAAAAFDAREMRSFRTDLAGNLSAHMGASLAVSGVLRGASLESKVLSSGLLLNTYCDPVANGAILLGDAGLHVDPLFGQGHSLALMSAEILGEMAPRWFSARSGRAISAAAMAEFREARDRALMPYYRPTVRASADLSLDRTTRLAHRVASREQWAADEMVRYAQMATAGTFPSFRLARAIALEAKTPA